LSEIAKIAIYSIEPLAIQKNVRIHFSNGSECYFNGDPEELEIIMNNLISNAVKYNKEGGKVFVTLKNDDIRVSLKVEDTGIGLSEEDKSKLFQEFVRIRNTKTKNITGSGLGLSIVRKLVDLYDGEIFVDGKPDQGSTFEVILPKNQVLSNEILLQ
jgi:signal transduction histidine kinase